MCKKQVFSCRGSYILNFKPVASLCGWADCFVPCEPCHEKTGFLHMQKQRHRSAQLISAFVFATQIVRFLNYPNSKFLVSSVQPVCVKAGRKPGRQVFSHCGSYLGTNNMLLWRNTVSYQLSLFLRKPVFGISDQV